MKLASNFKSILNKREELFAILKFLAKLTLLGILVHLALFLLAPKIDTLIFQETIAKFIAWAVSLLGFNSYSEGAFVVVNRAILRIVPDCLAFKSSLALTALIISANSNISKKIKGIFLGIIAIQIINLLRLTTVAISISYSEILFTLVHIYIWNFLMISAILSFWLLWSRKF